MDPIANCKIYPVPVISRKTFQKISSKLKQVAINTRKDQIIDFLYDILIENLRK
jgi:hypothetical protein